MNRLLWFLTGALGDLTQGPGLDWLGINGGFSQDYVDTLGRSWHHTKEKYAFHTWGGYVGEMPRDRFKLSHPEGNESLGTYQCRNWPPEYDQDYEALLHHYSKESKWQNQSFRVNLQQPDDPVSLYTVKYHFCETDRRGGSNWDILINGKTVKKDYTSKWAHQHTDIYHFKCIPTNAGMIEVSIVGSEKQARFSTLEFEKSTDGCAECEGMSCGKGLCSATSFYDKSFSGGWGARGISPWANEFASEEPQQLQQCVCDLGVEGASCENGTCAAVNCNEPFGGFCADGACTCLNGYSGASCEVAPARDEFGCYSDYVVSGKLLVSTVCLPELIAGPAGHGNLFRGPSPMSAVADKVQPDTVYFSWTADAKYGKAGANGTEGRVYVSKLKLPSGGLPNLEASYVFDGFARAGGIDMTEDGVVGTLCAKLWYPWVEHTNSHLDKAAMVLAVCEVNASSMTKHRTPWQIGKQYQESVSASNTGIWGSYPLSAWFAQRSVGYGYLIYAPAQRMWTAWYGATVDYHTGFAMHSYHRDAPPVSDEDYAKYKYPVPRDMVEPLQEADGPWRDHHRTGTGDHQASAAWFYHPKLKDIGLQKNTHWEVYMQQYGLAEEGIGIPAGEFARPGHKGSRVKMVHGDDTGRQANALRPCGDDWIMGIITDQGNVCAKVTRLGEIVTWKIIESEVAGMPCGSSGGNCGDGAPGRMLRLALLGVAEDVALCGAEARFLVGYEKNDRSRWLVEVDGNCDEVSEKMDVTRYTHWPLYQDWTTTRDGAVVWITAWQEDTKGDHGPAGSPNGVWPYKFRSLNAEGEYLFGLTPEATNAAKVTVYYPKPVEITVTNAPRGDTEPELSECHPLLVAYPLIVLLALMM